MSGKNKFSIEALKQFSIPIQLTDLWYGDVVAFAKGNFAARMKRVEEEMTKLSKNLLQLSGRTTTVAGLTSLTRLPSVCWRSITKSPLLEGEGSEKTLNLQFDLSEFDSSEVSVRIINDLLVVSASRQNIADDPLAPSSKKFYREFTLPEGTDPETVVSMMSQDGILTVRAPFHNDEPESVTPSQSQESLRSTDVSTTSKRDDPK